MYANDEKGERDENVEYMLDSIDVEKGKLTPGEPKNEFQANMAEYMNNIMKLRTELQRTISFIGTVEMNSMSDLANIDNIEILRNNLTQYTRVMKKYYDTVDALMREANLKIGKNQLAQKRLGGGTQFYEEQLEFSFLRYLDKYYEFLIENHDHLVFQGEQIYGTDDKVTDKYNALIDKVVTSSQNMNRIPL